MARPQVASAVMQAKVRAAQAAVLELVLFESGSWSLRAIRSSLISLLGAPAVPMMSTDVGKPTPVVCCGKVGLRWKMLFRMVLRHAEFS